MKWLYWILLNYRIGFRTTNDYGERMFGIWLNIDHADGSQLEQYWPYIKRVSWRKHVAGWFSYFGHRAMEEDFYDALFCVVDDLYYDALKALHAARTKKAEDEKKRGMAAERKTATTEGAWQHLVKKYGTEDEGEMIDMINQEYFEQVLEEEERQEAVRQRMLLTDKPQSPDCKDITGWDVK